MLGVDPNNLSREQIFKIIKFISNDALELRDEEGFNAAKKYNEELAYIYNKGARFTNELFDFLKEDPTFRAEKDEWHGYDINLESSLVSVIMIMFKNSSFTINDKEFKIDIFDQVDFSNNFEYGFANLGFGILKHIYKKVIEIEEDWEDLDILPFKSIRSRDEDLSGQFFDLGEDYEGEYPIKKEP